MKPTPELIQATYEWLRLTPPFDGWGLPDGDDLSFKVLGTRAKARGSRYSRFGDYSRDGAKREIRVSYLGARNAGTLLATVAHEMAHLAQDVHDAPLGHGASFKAMLRAVAKYHKIGLDPKTF